MYSGRPDRQFVPPGYKTGAALRRNICDNHAFAPNSTPQFPYVHRVSHPDAERFRRHAAHSARRPVHIPLLPDDRHSAGGAAGFRAYGLGLRLGDGGRGDQRQYFATLMSRPLAGRTADTLGPKKTVLYGLAACAASGVLLLGSALAAQWHAVSLALLVIARLVLGFGESWVGTGSITWGIGRVGVTNNAKVISWNGIATYGALAIGAPLGVAIEHALGFASLGLIVIALGGLGYWLATRMASVPVVHGERMSYRSVFFRVLPHGLGLALGSAGFGSIATFITLYYAAHNWPNAALSLTVFGTMFIGARLLFANTIKAYGGFAWRLCRLRSNARVC